MIRLTPTQSRVCALIGRRQSVKEIAADLQCSRKTVEYHLTQIMRRTGLHTYLDLSHLALAAGLATFDRTILDLACQVRPFIYHHLHD